MIKHIFNVEGVTDIGLKFKSKCIDEDIIHAIQMYRNEGLSVHSISQSTRAHADMEIKITYLVKEL